MFKSFTYGYVEKAPCMSLRIPRLTGVKQSGCIQRNDFQIARTYLDGFVPLWVLAVTSFKIFQQAPLSREPFFKLTTVAPQPPPLPLS